MKALILAAGVSRRLYPLTFHTPKCLLKVGTKAIIDYQLEALRENRILDIIIVVGYHRELLIDHLQRNFADLNFHFIINHHHFETNTSYSLYLARDELEQSSFLLMNGDVLYPPSLLRRILDSRHESVLAVEEKSCGREEVKVIEGAENRVVAIGKELIQENSLGEFIGVAKFSQNFNVKFADSLEHLIDAGGKADYFEAAIHPLLADSHVFYENVSDLPCIEIDFVEDLEMAQKLSESDWYK